MPPTLEPLHSLSADAEIQRLAFVSERALRAERNELFGAREEGIIQGEVTLLERLLRHRFGPVSEATRLQTATPRRPPQCADLPSALSSKAARKAGNATSRQVCGAAQPASSAPCRG